MTNIVNPDPYFDDEDEENEENYRQLLKKREPLPSCPSTTVPFSSLSQRCTLCSRLEAENILKTNVDVRPGHFIVRPSAHVNNPYSLSVLSNENGVYHFQISQTSNNKFVIRSVEAIDLNNSKIFPSLSALLEYYLKSPIKFQEKNNKEHSILLQLYSIVEITQF